MVKYKLIYPDAKARTEVTRLLLFLGEQEFEDYRFSLDVLKKEKPMAPFGQFPVIEIDGVKFCQSHSINRYLANTFGYAGKSPLDKLRADMIVDCTEDMFKALLPALFGEMGFEWKEDKRNQFEQEKLPGMLNKLETMLIQNNGGDGFLVGDDLTWADLSVWYIIDYLRGWQVKVKLNNTPKLKALFNRIENYPKVVEWKGKTEFSPHSFDVLSSKEEYQFLFVDSTKEVIKSVFEHATSQKYPSAEYDIYIRRCYTGSKKM